MCMGNGAGKLSLFSTAVACNPSMYLGHGVHLGPQRKVNDNSNGRYIG
jgi:hypothetical protein